MPLHVVMRGVKRGHSVFGKTERKDKPRAKGNLTSDILRVTGDANSGEEEGRKAEERVLPDTVEEACGQTHHPPKAGASLPGCQQGTQQGEETQNR